MNRLQRIEKRSSAAKALLLSGVCVGVVASLGVRSIAQDAGAASQPSTGESFALAPAGTGSNFKKMTLDELMNIEVTSVSRRESTVGQSPAAVHVITQDDIRRSGATNIPEALRMAPGMQVAQIDNSTWAITARGFNGSAANKLLVLMDGRSVYSPLFSGVFWDVQDTLMQNIERIEVIRGPAGTLWGANAVNGVINIITKDAKDTQGWMVTGGGGTELRDFGAVQYGWEIKEDVFARVYIKHFERDQTVFTGGGGGHDDFIMNRAGFRIDWQANRDNHYTLQGDIYQGDRNNLTASTTEDTDLDGGNILGRWTHTFQQGGDMRLQMYYDRTHRNIPDTFAEDRDTFDIDFQHHIPIGKRNDVTWGLAYRFTSDNVDNSPVIQFIPDHRSDNLYSAFVQDEIQLVPDKLRLTLGSKFEHNDYTGFEIQPSARLLWMINNQQSMWGAVSRAVRTPTRLEDDLLIVSGPVTIFGNRDFESEEVLAFELGYRVEPVKWAALDIATFYNSYDKLRSIDVVGTNLVEGNGVNGQTYGVEVGATLKLAEWWTVRTAYTYLQVQVQNDPDSTDAFSAAAEGNDPQNQVYVRSSFDLPHRMEFDIAMRYVGQLSGQGVPAYVAVDARLGWRPTDQLELAIVGQNLFDDRHPEFGTGASQHEIERGVYGTVTYRW